MKGYRQSYFDGEATRKAVQNGTVWAGVQAMLCASWAGRWMSGASPLPLLQEGVSVDSKMAPETRHAEVLDLC